ncbi:MAG: membrane lipoprotein lipid attachment site-containing protein [Ruminococcus sp.]|jgi:nitrous oxide reductase accessory protein NosL|nr:membrane lipoprotein lipid attachment site-containing protein [Ruminococcus sp.]
MKKTAAIISALVITAALAGCNAATNKPEGTTLPTAVSENGTYVTTPVQTENGTYAGTPATDVTTIPGQPDIVSEAEAAD